MSGFIARHALWTAEQYDQAEEIKARIEEHKIKLIRVAWADPHGVSRAKTVTVPAFLGALQDGYNINVATAMLDASGARTFASFTRGGGMGLDEMTGSPNLIVVPDPSTFCVLPWEPGIGWILGDEYFPDGTPFHFSARRLLRKQVARLEKRGLKSRIGLEIEWYMLRLAEDEMTDEQVGRPGLRGKPPRTRPVEPGYSYHSETNMDRMQAPLSALTDALERLGLPLRSIENEWGPGQVECTFAPRDALQAADQVMLFRSATRQICRRMGYLATFMSRPGFEGFCSSGWHLHQSLVNAANGRNLFTAERAGAALSATGMHYLGGLMHHAAASTILANPTLNAYRRFRANSLAPDRITWGIDHRGVMLRVLGGFEDPASRIENRIGEPSANPYFYIASQIAAGLSGIDHDSDPGQPDTDPYAAQRVMLPRSLPDALVLFQNETLFREQFGELFVDYYAALKTTEINRFNSFIRDHGIDPTLDSTTEWEQNEYFDFF